MAVSAANSPHILYRELCHIDNHLPQQQQQSYASTTLPAAGFSKALGRRERWERVSRREVKAAAAAAGAFWQGLSRPSSIEMEHIADSEQLDRIIQESKEFSQPFLIDWMAAWCRKCIYLKPKLEKLAAEYDGRAKFYYVDVNKVSQALVKRGNIAKMPTIQLWKDGEMKEEVIGGHKAWLVVEEVREMIQKHI